MATPQPNVEAQAPEAKGNTVEENLGKFRKLFEQERAARLKAEEKTAQLEQEKQARGPAPGSDDEVSDESDDDDEPYVQRKSLKKTLAREREIIKKEVKEEALKEARNMFAQEKQQSYLKSNADFQQVMNPEVMQRFVDKCPGIAEGILSMPDSFERQKLVYETIKAMNLHKPEEAKPSIQDTINANKKSPYYQPSSMSSAPYAAQGDFSPSGKKAAYDKIQELKARLRTG